MSKTALLEVLKRAAEDDGFLAKLADDATKAMERFGLTSEE